MATIITKNSSTASSVPLNTQLVQGELAVNVTDKRLFTENASGTVVELGTNPSSLTLPNGVANGVCYLNGSKVLTTGSALVFDGTNLGLGVTPSAWGASYTAFQLKGGGSLHYDNSGNAVYLGQNVYGNAGNKYISTAAASLYAQGGGAHYWYTAPSGTAGNAISFTQAMTLDASGNLGVGQTPTAYGATVRNVEAYIAGASGFTLVSAASASVKTEITASEGSLLGQVGTRTNHPLVLKTNDTERARIDSSGNFGIGTSSPLGKMTVRGLSGYNLTIGAVGTDARIDATNDNGSGSVDFVLSGSSLKFNTSGTERARIDSSGNLLVGTTTNTLDGKLFVESTKGTQVAVTHNNSAGQVFFSNGVAAAGTGWRHFNGVSSNNTVQNIIIYGNGNIQNANNSYGAISDAKLKENIVDATPKLEKLQQVRVVNYNLKGDYEQHKQLGVIAQELEQIFPGMVEETPDRDAEGNDLGTTTKSVKYSVFVPMLIKAIQEQQAIIEQLKSDVAALKGAA